MTKTETIILARAAYDALTCFPEIARAYEVAADGERKHRGRGGDFRRYHPGAASVDACACLFVSRWTAEYALHPDRIPTLAEALHMRPEAVLCAMVVAERGASEVLAILQAAGLDPSAVAALNYVTAVGQIA